MAAAGGAVRQIRVVFAGDSKGLNKTARAGGKQLDGWRVKFEQVNRAAVKWSAGVLTAAGVAGKQLFDVGQRMDELDTKSRTVFEDQLSDVQKWAKENRKAFGTSSREVTALAANFADLLKPMGFTTAEAAAMAKEVTGLAPALARWEGKGRSAAEVQDILAKAMLGEREGLKSLGISITEADVQRQLQKQGLEDLTGAELEQAKAIATRDLIMAKSTDAQAAWTNGGRAAAEQQGALTSAMQTTKESLATALTPAFEAGLALVERFSGVLERNTGTVKIAGAAVIGLAGFVLAANGAYKAYRATMLAVTAATKALAAAQKVLNLVMRANPIGLVVTALFAVGAALVAAWNKSETFRRIVTGAWNAVKSAAQSVVGFFTSIPGKIGRVFGRVKNIISRPFTSAFRAIKRWWNDNIAGFGFTTPEWLPGDPVDFRIPRMHSGGVFTPPDGRSEGLAWLRRGERVLTPAQAERDEQITVNVMLSKESIAELARVEIRRNDEDLRTAVLAGSGTR